MLVYIINSKNYELWCRRIQFAISIFTIEIWVPHFCTSPHDTPCYFDARHRNFRSTRVQNGATQILMVKILMADWMRLHNSKNYALSCRRIRFAINTFTIEIWVAPFCTRQFRTKKVVAHRNKTVYRVAGAKVRNPGLDGKNTYGKLNVPKP